MSRRTRVALFIALLVVAAVAPVQWSNASMVHGVEAAGTSFSPAHLSASAGDLVLFSMTDGPHTVTADDGSFDFGPDGPGASYGLRLHADGTYRYHCKIHGGPGGIGMAGTIQVASGVGTTTTTTFPMPTTTTAPRPVTTSTTRPPLPPPTTPPTTTPLPAGPVGRAGPTTNHPGGVNVVRSWEWDQAGAGSRYLVGEVENSSATTVFLTKITIDMLDAGGRLVATDYTYLSTSYLDPGDRAGFEIRLSPPSDYVTAVARVSADAAYGQSNHNFTVSITNRYTNAYGSEHIVGLVRNDNIAPVDSVWVYGTFFDAAGRPAGQAVDLVTGQLPAGQTVSWEFVRSADRAPYVASHLYAESSSEAALPVVEPPADPGTNDGSYGPLLGPGSGRRSGYWMVGSSGAVYAFGTATDFGGITGPLGKATAVDLEPIPSGNGYWIVDDTGRVYPFGDAADFGSAGGIRSATGERVTSLSTTPSGRGYWIFTSAGRVLPFGDAAFLGDVSHLRLAGPVLDSIVTPSGRGYYMVASDGGIFAFGDADFHGSMGGHKLNAPVQSLVPDGDGIGYWLVASDGGIFAFRAGFRGSLGGIKLNKPVTGMVRAGSGYLMVGEDGGIFDFSGDPQGFQGSLGDRPPARPITAVAVAP